MTPSGEKQPEDGIGADAAGSAPPLRGRRGRAATVLALLATPAVVFFGLRVMPFSIQNGVDPFIYVGYQQSLGDLIERFGYSYYFPVRFGLLLPLRAASWAFGAVPGYFVARYVLALGAAVALHALGRSHGSRSAGWVGALACLCSPIFLGAIMTVYTDTVAVPCMVGGLALLLMPTQRSRPLRAATAGVLFGLAFNTNLFIGPLLVAAFLCRAVLHVLRREWFAFVDWLVVVAGVVAVTVVGSVYYGVAFGDPDILSPSIDAARLYSGEAGLVFRSPTSAWLTFSPHLYIPALIGIALLVVLLMRRVVPGEARWARVIQSGACDALVLLVGAQAFFLIQEFVLRGYSMETYYYYSFMWPFAMTALVMVMVELSAHRSFGRAGLWAVAVTLGLTPLVHDLLFDGLELWPSWAVPVFVVIVAGGLLASRIVPRAVWVGAIGLGVGISLLAIAPPRDVPLSEGQNFRWDPHYEDTTGNPDHLGLSYYRASAELADVVPRWKDDPGSTVYWYRNSSLALNSIQSSGLWRDATIDLGGSQYPVLDPDNITMLKGRTPRHIVVLGRSALDMDVGVDALAKVLTPLSTRLVTIGDDTVRVHVAIMTYRASPCDQDWRERSGWATLGVCP